MMNGPFTNAGSGCIHARWPYPSVVNSIICLYAGVEIQLTQSSKFSSCRCCPWAMAWPPGYVGRRTYLHMVFRICILDITKANKLCNMMLLLPGWCGRLVTLLTLFLSLSTLTHHMRVIFLLNIIGRKGGWARRSGCRGSMNGRGWYAQSLCRYGRVRCACVFSSLPFPVFPSPWRLFIGVTEKLSEH